MANTKENGFYFNFTFGPIKSGSSMAKGNRRDLLERNDIEVKKRDEYTIHALGKKKNSVAVAFVKAGKGDILVNNVPLALVRPEILRTKVSEPIMILGEGLFKGLDMNIKVAGGGHVSQIYAVRQAISRGVLASVKDEAARSELRAKLVSYDRQLVVSDPRRCEAKKFGGRGARARRQKSYR